MSFQDNIFKFVQSRLAGFIDIIWSILNKTPALRQPGPAGAGQQEQTSAGGFSMDSAMNLWKAYGPAVMAGLSRPAGPGQPAAQPGASSASFQPNVTPTADRRPSNSSINSTSP